jgi:hypothetical protein
MWGPARRFGVVASIALLVGVALTTWSPSFAAEDDESGLQIEATAGYAGLYVSGLPVPVRVTVHADRLVKGYLRVTSKFAAGPSLPPGIESPIEVAGGSVKDYIVTIPTSANGPFDGSSLVVELVAGGRVQDRVDVPLTAGVDTELVGVLPGLFAAKPPPQAAPLVPAAGTAKFIAIGALELEAGADALAPLDMIAASADDLSRLSARERDAVHRWIANGGRLLVDSHSDVAGLPAAWQPNSAGRTFAGFGDVVSLARESWFADLRPSPYVGPYFSVNNGMPASMGVAGDAGVKAARLSWLRVFLIVYVIVVGPIVAIALARARRREWVWAAVPVTALLFTGGAWFAGKENRDQVVRAHGSMVYLMPDQRASVQTFVGTMSQGGGTAKVKTPEGWRPAATSNFFGNGVVDQSTTKWRDRELSLSLQPGQFGVAVVTGPTTFEGSLTVTASAMSDTDITGTIRNLTGYALERVVVFASGNSTVVGSIADDGTAQFMLRGSGVQERFGPTSSWPGEEMFRGGPVNDTSPTNPGVVLETMQSLGVDLSANGRVVVVGWTREYRPPVEIDGHAPKNGRTAIVATAPIDGGAKLATVGQHVEAVRAADFRKGPNTTPSVYAVSQPGVNLTGKRLELQVGGTFTSVEIWDGSRWLLARGDLNAARPVGGGAATSMSVPAGAVVDGTVYVRVGSFGEPLGLRGLPMILREV